MSKIFALFAQYKYAILAGMFLAVAAVTWDISGKVKENEFNSERIKLLNQTIEAQKANDKLKTEITTTLLQALAVSEEDIKRANKAAVNEILTDPRYRTCTITPGVRNAYRDTISAQQPSSRSNGKVQAAPAAPVR